MKKTMLAFLLAMSTVLTPAAAYAAEPETETTAAADAAAETDTEAAAETDAKAAAETDAKAAAETNTEASADASWDTTIDPAITDEAQTLFEKAAEKLMGVSYEPIAVLATETEASGQEEGEEGAVTTCFLCRASVVYPGAKPYYVLMYVHEAADGAVTVQNIWKLWIDAHSEQ